MDLDVGESERRMPNTASEFNEEPAPCMRTEKRSGERGSTYVRYVLVLNMLPECAVGFRTAYAVTSANGSTT